MNAALAVLILIGTSACNPGDTSGNREITKEEVFEGNKIGFVSVAKVDSIPKRDPVTSDISWIRYEIDEPGAINSVSITRDKSGAVSKAVEKEIINRLKYIDDMRYLPDGVVKIRLTNIVSGEDGSLPYYYLYSQEYIGSDSLTRTIDIKQDIENIVREVVADNKGSYKDKYVLLDVDLSKYDFVISDSTVSVR